MKFNILYEQLLQENKEHIIKKMPKLLTIEKTILIDFFKEKPNLENKIDWNKWKTLEYEDFKDVMETTKTERKKNVKEGGIGGLKEGKDFIELDSGNDDVKLYIPLHRQASILLASKDIGPCTGKWCTAFQKNSEYWEHYHLDDTVLIYVITPKTKYAIVYNFKDKNFKEFRDHEDADIIHRLPTEIDYLSVINQYADVAKKAKEKIIKNDEIIRINLEVINAIEKRDDEKILSLINQYGDKIKRTSHIIDPLIQTDNLYLLEKIFIKSNYSLNQIKNYLTAPVVELSRKNKLENKKYKWIDWLFNSDKMKKVFWDVQFLNNEDIIYEKNFIFTYLDALIDFPIPLKQILTSKAVSDFFKRHGEFDTIPIFLQRLIVNREKELVDFVLSNPHFKLSEEKRNYLNKVLSEFF